MTQTAKKVILSPLVNNKPAKIVIDAIRMYNTGNGQATIPASHTPPANAIVIQTKIEFIRSPIEKNLFSSISDSLFYLPYFYTKSLLFLLIFLFLCRNTDKSKKSHKLNCAPNNIKKFLNIEVQFGLGDSIFSYAKKFLNFSFNPCIVFITTAFPITVMRFRNKFDRIDPFNAFIGIHFGHDQPCRTA